MLHNKLPIRKARFIILSGTSETTERTTPPDIWSFGSMVSLPLPHNSEIIPLCHALLGNFIYDPQILHALCASYHLVFPSFFHHVPSRLHMEAYARDEANVT